MSGGQSDLTTLPVSSEVPESQVIANVLRELQKYPISTSWVRDPQLIADAKKYGAEATVRCLYEFRMLPSDVAERFIR